MTDKTEVTSKTEVEVTGKTKIEPNTSAYIKAKSASGSASMHNGDSVAITLVGMNVGEVMAIAVVLTGQEDLATRYSHLNIGQQRMNLGNRIRGAVAKIDKGNVTAIAAHEKAEAAHMEAYNKTVEAYNEYLVAVNGAEEGVEVAAVAEPGDYTSLDVPAEGQSGADKLAEVAKGQIESRDKREKEVADAKEKAAAEKAEKAEAKKKAADTKAEEKELDEVEVEAEDAA